MLNTDTSEVPLPPRRSDRQRQCEPRVTAGAQLTARNATLTVTDPDADGDSDGIPTITESALSTSGSTTSGDSGNTQQQNIHRPTS